VGKFVDLKGVKIWYEEQGAGEPVLLLHGDLVSSGSWQFQVPVLAKQYRIITTDRRGHGRSPDQPGPITYEVMSRDTIAFLEKTLSEPAHLIGWSGGANVAILVAMMRPDLVNKLVILSTINHHNGFAHGVRDDLWNMAIDDISQRMRMEYENLSPDGPKHFPIVFDKIRQLSKTEPFWEVEDLASLAMSAMVMVGDDDLVSLEHALEIYRALPHGQLAVVPGASHCLCIEKPKAVNRLLLDFLAAEQPPKLMSPPKK